MMPVINSITLLRIMVERNKINAIIAIAPTKAPSIIVTKPETLNVVVVMLPPNANITRATPKLAPASMPKMEGPAKGFFNAVCNIKPQTAKEAPHNNAVNACGKRLCQIMKRQLALPTSSPMRMRNTSPAGIDTDPTSRFAINSTTMMTARHKPYLTPLLT